MEGRGRTRTLLLAPLLLAIIGSTLATTQSIGLATAAADIPSAPGEAYLAHVHLPDPENPGWRLETRFDASQAARSSISPAAQQLIDCLNNAIATHASTFTISGPMNYTFGNVSLVVRGAANMIISAEPGAELVFAIGAGLNFVECANITTQDLVIDYYPTNYAQGTVVKKESDLCYQARFQPLPFVYPDPTLTPSFRHPGGLSGAKVALFDPATLFQSYHGNQFFNYSTALDSHGLYRICLQHPIQGTLGPGLLTAIYPRIGLTYLLTNSSAIVTERLTIYGAGNMALVEDRGTCGHRWLGVQVVRRPGRQPTPLLASNADGFHSSNCRLGPTLINTTISYTGDDHFNCHNRLQVLWQADGASALLIDTEGDLTLPLVQPGETLSFYQLNTLRHLATGTVVSIDRITDPAILNQTAKAFEEMNGAPYNAKILRPFGNGVYNVTFLTALPANATRFSLFNYDSIVGRGAVLRGNHFVSSYSRAGLLKCVGMTVENNVFERAAGLHVVTEQPWLEGAAGLRDTVVVNNTFVHLGDPPLTIAPYATNITARDNKIVPGPP